MFGLDYFLHFIPYQPSHTGDAEIFKEGLKSNRLDKVNVEVYENEITLIETTTTDTNGIFILKKLDYEKKYNVYFSKEGYYKRKIRVYTISVPDSLKNRKLFRNRFRRI